MTASELRTRIWRGSELRRTRFHDEKGALALRRPADLSDCAFALATAILRKTVGVRLRRPWIALPAWRYVKPRLSRSTAVFEWGCGMSTIWYGRHCGEVHAVEDDPEWHRVVSLRAGSASVYCAPDEDAYVDKIREFPRAHFDLIVIDGSHRYGCFQAAPAYLKPGGLLLIDNSDKDRTTQGDLWLIDRDLDRSESAYEVLRFTGWAPGNFFPQETTVVTCRR